MANYKLTVEIVIDADSEDEAEHGLEGALQNLVGSDILSATIVDVVAQIETGG